jgi:hypothetical protein
VVFAGTERQCTEDEHDDEDENDSQISEFGLKRFGETPICRTGSSHRRAVRIQPGFNPGTVLAARRPEGALA